jgi:hypothetical protein
LTEEEMLARLRRTLIKRGRLSPTIINATVGLPSARTYIYHFGTLRNAYRLIGYTSRRTLDYFDSRQTWADQLAKLAPQVAAKIEKLGERVVAYSNVGPCLLDGSSPSDWGSEIRPSSTTCCCA